MVQKYAVVKSVIGIHARPATLLVKIAGKYKSELFLTFNDRRVNLRSIFDIMGAGITGGSTVTVEADGEDETEAVNAVKELIEIAD